MTFEEFAVNPYEQNSFWLGLIFCLVGIALVIGLVWNLISTLEESSKGPVIRLVIFFLALVGLIVVAVNITGASHAVNHQNEKIAENNLKQKYDIVGVLWDETRTSAQTYNSLGEITVQDNDSNIVKFRYRVDKETREPYLLNESENAHVKANDLLRNKTEK